MPYAVVAVETFGSWPVTDVTVKFAGRTLTLRPGSKTRYATIFVQYEPDAQAAWVEAVTVIRRFLSSFSWVEGTAIQDVPAFCWNTFAKSKEHEPSSSWPRSSPAVTPTSRPRCRRRPWGVTVADFDLYYANYVKPRDCEIPSRSRAD